MNIKTSELTDAALDWAVAKCEGKVWAVWRFKEEHRDGNHQYGEDWSLAGPIIEREGISVERRMPCMKDEQWGAQGWKAMQNFHKGPTPLITAMRCYVASKLGDEVEIPEELTA